MRDSADAVSFGLFTGMDDFSTHRLAPIGADYLPSGGVTGSSMEAGGVVAVAEVTTQEFQHALLSAINGASPEGILVVDGEGTLVSYNQRVLDVWGIPQHLMAGVGVGSQIGTLEDPLLAAVCDLVKDPAAFRDRVRQLHYAPELDDDCEIELKDGRTLARVSTALYGRRSEYLGRVWFYRDVSPEKRAQAQLEALAREDSLTGIRCLLCASSAIPRPQSHAQDSPRNDRRAGRGRC